MIRFNDNIVFCRVVARRDHTNQGFKGQGFVIAMICDDSIFKDLKGATKEQQGSNLIRT